MNVRRIALVGGIGGAAIAIAFIVATRSRGDDSRRPELPQPQLSAEIPIMKLLDLDPQFKTFRGYVVTAGTDELLAEDGPFTVLAPSSAAIAATDPAVLESIVGDPEEVLPTTVRRHILPGRLRVRDLAKADGATVTNLAGEELPITVSGNAVSIGGVALAKTDIEAKNGEIHVLDTFLPPPG